MSTKPISVAVIGAGMAGRTHANAWRQASTLYEPGVLPPVRLAAICDAFEPFAKASAESYGYERYATDWKEIAAADDIDVVSIVVANRLHREIAEALILAGKHVLCEKPLTDTLEDAKAMTEVAEAHPEVVTGIGFGYRRHASIAKIAELAQNGDLGEVFHFDGRYWCDYGVDPNTPIAWRYKGPMGSGALGDVGSHMTDVAEFICGPIKRISGATLSTVIKKRPPAVEGVAGGRGMAVEAEATEVVENDDVAMFNAEFENGAVGSISVSRVAFGDPNALMFDVMGTKAKASFDLARGGEILLNDETAEPGMRGPRQILTGQNFPYFKGGSSMDFAGVGTIQIDQFNFQARAFLGQVAGIDEGLPPVPSFAHGYRAIRIQNAVAESAANNGAAVEIN